jgi:glycerol-3-phosphate O-acyltransferase
VYTIAHDKRFALDTSKNIIIHFFVERSLVALALLAAPGTPLPTQTARERVRWLSRLFKHEFRFRADAPFEAIFDQTVAAMLSRGCIATSDSSLRPGPGQQGYSGEKWLTMYAAILRNFVEGYRVAARGLTLLLKGPLAERDLVKRTLAVGSQMFYAGEIEQRESVSKPIIQNAFRAFADFKVVAQREGRVHLSDGISQADPVEGVETNIAVYLKDVAW